VRLLSAKSEELEGLRDGERRDSEVDAVDAVGATDATHDVAGSEGVDVRAEAEGPGEQQVVAEDGAAAPDEARSSMADTVVVDTPKADLADTVVVSPSEVTVSMADTVVVDTSQAIASGAGTPDVGSPVESDPLSDTHERDHMRVRPAGSSARRSEGVADSAQVSDEAVAGLADSPEVPQDVAEETARAVAEASDSASASESGSGSGAETAADDEADAEAPFPARRVRHTPLYGRGFRVLPWKHKARLNPKQRRRRRIVVRSLWGAVLVFFGTISWSVAGALTTPGTDTVQARLAEWGRDHGLGSVVATLEQWQYDLNPPSKGGSVDARQFTNLGPTTGLPSQAQPGKPGSSVPGKPGAPSSAPADVIAMLPRMPAPPGLTLEAGEGVFQVAVQTPSGQPVVQIARIRPDSTYTDVAADVAVIDQKHTSYVLHPGHEGGLNGIITNVPNQIDANARPNLIALFNGGFKISESHGGYYDHGVTAAPLVEGAASEVIFKDGHMSIGMWGRDYSFQKNADIVSVRQNLKLMVDGGQVVPYIDDSSNWGRADHGSAAVWRSGIGVTANGDIVWVGGNKLTAPSLARLLKDAGAVRGMQLDINLRWADFQYFPARDGDPANSKLYEDFLQGPNKFFVNSTKDFMAVYLR
jgi:hypothetical protein